MTTEHPDNRNHQWRRHRRIADEYCGGAAVTKFPTKYFRIEMRREFVVRVIGTLLVVLYYLIYTSKQKYIV